MNKPKALIFLAAIIVLGIIYILLQNQQSNFLDNLLSFDNGNNNPTENGDLPEDENSQAFDEEEGNSQGSYRNSAGQTCSLKPLSYSLKKFVKNSECLTYQDETCIEKRVDCMVEVTNLDHASSGEFEIKTEFFETADNILDSSISVQLLAPQESKVFNDSMTFTAAEATKELTCSIGTGEIPKKEICN